MITWKRRTPINDFPIFPSSTIFNLEKWVLISTLIMGLGAWRLLLALIGGNLLRIGNLSDLFSYIFFTNFTFLFSPSSFSNKKILFTREITMTQKLNNFLSLDLSSWAPVYFTNERLKYFRTFDWPLFVKLFLPLLYKVKSFNPCLLSHAVILNSIYYNLKVY